MKLLFATALILAAIVTAGMSHTNPAEPATSQQLTKCGFRSFAAKAAAAGAGCLDQVLLRKPFEQFAKDLPPEVPEMATKDPNPHDFVPVAQVIKMAQTMLFSNKYDSESDN
ncbi:hypothetical protein H4R33_004431, partial [Dimargaris cristalligena]